MIGKPITTHRKICKTSAKCTLMINETNFWMPAYIVAAAFLTEAYVHPGPRMPPPETGRDDLAPGLAHAIVAVLVYALLARRRRCCESKQRMGKRE